MGVSGRVAQGVQKVQAQGRPKASLPRSAGRLNRLSLPNIARAARTVDDEGRGLRLRVVGRRLDAQRAPLTGSDVHDWTQHPLVVEVLEYTEEPRDQCEARNIHRATGLSAEMDTLLHRLLCATLNISSIQGFAHLHSSARPLWLAQDFFSSLSLTIPTLSTRISSLMPVSPTHHTASISPHSSPGPLSSPGPRPLTWSVLSVSSHSSFVMLASRPVK